MGKNINKHVFSLVFPLCQEFKSGLAGQFWFKVPHEIAVKVLTRPAIIKGLPGAGRSTPRWLIHMAREWVLGVGRRPHLLCTWALSTFTSTKGTLGILMTLWQSLPRTSNPRYSANRSSLFLWPSLKSHILCHIVFVRSKSQILAPIHGKDN